MYVIVPTDKGIIRYPHIFLQLILRGEAGTKKPKTEYEDKAKNVA